MSTSDPTIMPHPNHPDGELLAALAASEPDVAADTSLVDHLATCERCAGVVDELRSLRAALAQLPDIAPTRPLRLIPPVEPAPAPISTGWVGILRRVTGPLMGVGAVLILVGALGTAASSGIPGQAASNAALSQDLGARASGSPPGEEPLSAASSGGTRTGGAPVGTPTTPPTASGFLGYSDGKTAARPPDALAPTSPPAGRPPFEWVLGAGVVLLATAFVARGAIRRREPPETA